MSRIILSKADVLWNYVGTIVSLSSSFVLLPFLLLCLTPNELGLWYVFIAYNGFVVLLEFGFTPTLSRNITYCWEGADSLTAVGVNRSPDNTLNIPLFRAMLSVCRSVYSVIAIIASVVMLLPGSLYILLIGQGIDAYIALTAWGVFSAGSILNMFFLYYGAFLRGIGKVGQESRIKAVSKLAQLGCSIVLLLLGFGLVGAAFGFFVGTIIYRIACNRAFWRDPTIASLNLELTEVSTREKRELFKTVSHNAFRDGIVQLSNYAATQAMTIIASLCFSLGTTGVVSLYMQLATGVYNISLVFITASRPMMQSKIQSGRLDDVRTLAGRGVLMFVVLFCAGLLAIFIFVNPLLQIIQQNLDYDALLELCILLYMFCFGWFSAYATIISNMNEIPYMTAYAISSLAGIILATLFCVVLHLGPYGLVSGMFIPQIAYNFWKWPNEACRKMETSIGELLRIGITNFRLRLYDK